MASFLVSNTDDMTNQSSLPTGVEPMTLWLLVWAHLSKSGLNPSLKLNWLINPLVNVFSGMLTVC